MGRGRNTGPTLYESDTVSVSWDTDMKAQLEAFAKEVREKALRSATFAMANVIYKEIRLRVPVDEGELFGAIYQYHSDRESGGSKQVYYVGVNKVKAPHWHNVEYGHWRINKLVQVGGKWVATKERLASPVWTPAVPYMRPAFDASIGRALEAGKIRLAERVQEIVA